MNKDGLKQLLNDLEKEMTKFRQPCLFFSSIPPDEVVDFMQKYNYKYEILPKMDGFQWEENTVYILESELKPIKLIFEGSNINEKDCFFNNGNLFNVMSSWMW